MEKISRAGSRNGTVLCTKGGRVSGGLGRGTQGWLSQVGVVRGGKGGHCHYPSSTGV